MEIGTVLSSAQTLIAALECSHLKDALSMFSYESETKDLQRTVECLTGVLEDAEAKQQLLKQDQVCIKHIKDVIFEADDLIDELQTLARQQRIMDADANVTFLQKFSHFFSKSNPVYVSYWRSRGFKDVKKKLDAIAYNKQFNIQIDHQPIRIRSRETCSYVDEAQIIGREHDLEYIVGTLLASGNQNRSNVSVISIVGIGGLGKTALAQLVYNDPRVREAFPLKMWTCVADQDQKVLDVSDFLAKILGGSQGGSTLEEMQSQLRDQLAGQKFLLVLDDVWTENRDLWSKWAEYLIGGKRGSYIVVTTRSQRTAEITGGQVYVLSGLSKENSWHLFEKTAFTSSEQSNRPNEELVEIGEKIVDGCAGVPLAIRVAGSLLYGQSKNKWLSVQNIGLANIRDADNGIVPILELSFHNLESPLKNCFRYCAVFPKDHQLKKEMLINLWMAQGYVVPLDIGQNIDDAGEEYFSILLKRCFFQDVKKNRDGEIESCKIHDLMHDIAQKVSGKEILAANTHNGKVDKDVRHLSISNWRQFKNCFSLGSTHITHIRSFLPINVRPHILYHCELPMEAFVKSFKRLRVLDLSEKNIKCLSDSIGELLHLRYLDLSFNEEMEALPDSITKLCNLQTLTLCWCYQLKELPKDFNRLVKLRVFDISGCRMLRCMPKGMGKLTSLHTLKGKYKVGEDRPYKSWKQWLDALEDLKSLVNLKGILEIQITWPNEDVKNDTQEDRLREGLYLSSLEHLDYLQLYFFDEDDGMEDEDDGMEDEGMDDEDEGMEDEGMRMRVMEALQPHSNLTSLEMMWYQGTEMPGWITLLPNLVKLELEFCKKLKYLPCLGKYLCHLKSLRLFKLPQLEYIKIEESSRELASTSSTAQNLSFYPSLQYLQLLELRKLKGWRRGIELELKTHLIIFPQLKELEISESEEFTCSILCPMLETLTLKDVNEEMQIEWTNTNDEKSSDEAAINVPNLRELTVTNGAWLDSMPVESFQSLQKLRIEENYFMRKLPNNLQYLSALQTLVIHNCENLTEMPNWMPKLTSLKHLFIELKFRYWRPMSHNYKRLKERCQKEPPGEYWPLIQHIPDFRIY